MIRFGLRIGLAMSDLHRGQNVRLRSSLESHHERLRPIDQKQDIIQMYFLIVPS